jgi:hypothetical protein
MHSELLRATAVAGDPWWFMPTQPRTPPERDPFANSFPPKGPFFRKEPPSRGPETGALWTTDVGRENGKQWSAAIDEAINNSKWMLQLAEDWDEEGSPPIDEATWNAATAFLRRQADIHWRRYSKMIPVPHIAPGSDGSIDIHWKTENFELLVNIPARPGSGAGFYGDDYGGSRIKGVLDPTSESAYPLVACLIEE